MALIAGVSGANLQTASKPEDDPSICILPHRHYHSHSLTPGTPSLNSVSLIRSKSALPHADCTSWAISGPAIAICIPLIPPCCASIIFRQTPTSVFPRGLHLRLPPTYTRSSPLLQLKLRRQVLGCVPLAVGNSMSHGQSFGEGRSSRSRTRRQEKGIPKFLVQSTTGRF